MTIKYAIVSALLSCSLVASTISVDFTGGNTSMASSETAGVVAKTNWNSAAGAVGIALTLKDETGVATGTSITWTSDNTWDTPITDVAGNVRMMRGYLDTGNGNASTVNVSGLPAGKYNVYVYTDGDNAGLSHTGVYQISGTGVATSSTSAIDPPNTNFSGTFNQATNSNGNYVLFSGVTVTSGFTLTATPSVSRAPINGIQIVPTATVTITAPKTMAVTLPSSATPGATISFPSAGSYIVSTSVGGVTAQTVVTVTAAPVVVEASPTPLPAPTPTPAPATTADIVYPAGSGVFSVKSYGAVGDGVADDTNAIRATMYDAWNKQGNVVYFPAGTYLISDSLVWKNQAGTWLAWLGFQGQNQATTKIKLKDNSAGFGATGCAPMYAGVAITCKSVLYAASNQETNPVGGGESAYITDIRDLTIDTGAGNPGSQAIDWAASNTAAIRNVTVMGSGRVAVNTSRGWGGGGNGPALIKNLTVNGSFDYGVVSGSGEVGLTWEHILINNPKVAGFWNQDQNAWVRDLQVTTTGAVPAVMNAGNGNMTLIDPKATGSSGASAIQNTAWLFARNVQSTGFSAAVQGVGGVLLSEYVSSPVTTLFAGSALTSMNLPVSETPVPYSDTNTANWAVVSAYGALPNGQDCTAAVQAAFNSGKPIVFFPAGAYVVSGTLNVPASVSRIWGPWANFTANGSAVLKFNGTVQDIRQFSFAGNVSVLNNTSGSLTVADVFNLDGYSNVPGSGLTAYFEDAAIPNTITQHGGNVWARQLDVENDVTHVVNDGATFWTLGYKTEGTGASGTGQGLWYTQNGGHTEILGAFNSTPGPATYLGYFTVNSASSIAGLSSGSVRSTVLTETRGATTDTLANTGNRYGGTAITLYSGR